jgi:hypothetical protein
MAVQWHEDAEIGAEHYGKAASIPEFAPGGMRSRGAMWHSPSDGQEHLVAQHVRVLALMGQHTRPITSPASRAGRWCDGAMVRWCDGAMV